jgi:hypothetical protein
MIYVHTLIIVCVTNLWMIHFIKNYIQVSQKWRILTVHYGVEEITVNFRKMLKKNLLDLFC